MVNFGRVDIVADAVDHDLELLQLRMIVNTVETHFHWQITVASICAVQARLFVRILVFTADIGARYEISRAARRYR